MGGAMFEIQLEAAADILDYPMTLPDRVEEGYFGVIHNNKVVASPFYMSEVMPVSTEFFLLTTHARIAAYFHEVRKQPVWICNKVEDFYSLRIPPFAGRDEAWILTSQKQYPIARPYIEQNTLKARHIFSLGGYEPDLMRAFLPGKYEELY